MSRAPLWLVASLAFVSVTPLADGAPLYVMSAPNLLRVGTAENIFVECQDCSGGDITVEIIVMYHPTKSRRLASTSVSLTGAKNFQELAQITIPPYDFNKDPDTKQYVYLQAQFPDRLLEKVVLVSFQSGYIFIQTDKTLYAPKSRVNFRMFALTPRMEPVERTPQNDASINIEIVTPEDEVLSLDPVSLKSGMFVGQYNLDEAVSPGQWKVVARFHSFPQISFSAEFEVKEYVLPSFEVKLVPLITFFSVDSQALSVNIKASYLCGREVDGMAYVVFGVISEDQKRSFPGSLQKVPVTRGYGVVTLRREHITATFPNINELVGKSIFVAVSVLSKNGGEMVEAELRGIQVVTSPYSIHFRSTPKFFKPGMPFDITVEVLNPDGSPAKDVPVVVEPGHVQGFTSGNGMAKLTINTGTIGFTITARTNDGTISRQASATMHTLPYTSEGNNYISIGVDAVEPSLGDNLKINFFLKRQPSNNDVTYLILSRGQLVKNGHFKTQDHQIHISLYIAITKEMLPSFRIVAYYYTDGNEIVSDSVRVDVKDTCAGRLSLESVIPSPSYNPRKVFRLKVTGDPEATVGLAVVDKAVHLLNNKHHSTQEKVWDFVEKLDTGCTPGGGKDAMSVFYDAGLLFETNATPGTPYRQELKCPTSNRRRRRNTVMDVRTTLASQYDDKLQRDSSVDGMRETNLTSTSEGKESKRIERREANLRLTRSDTDEDSYLDSDEILSRSKLPESWLWFDSQLPSCPQHTQTNCGTTSFMKTIPLPDSITTWQFTGISMSRTHGICVGEPLEIITLKEFFIDVKLPYSAVRGEQTEVKAILHNYSPDTATVRVDLIEEEQMCSDASNHGRYRQEVTVAAQSTLSLPFIIIPLKDGEYRISVKASVKDSYLHDGIMRMLWVVPGGELVRYSKTIALNPRNEPVGIQEVIINSQIPKEDQAPNTPISREVFVTGKKAAVSFEENTISGNSMDTLIHRPFGDGEQNMIHMTLLVIATIYLDQTNQWETVGFQKRNEAIQHIMAGYQNELAYRKTDGSFAMSASRPSSTWLTAYVAKVFVMVGHAMAAQSKHVCDAIKFMILMAQQQDGMFREVQKVAHEEMTGDVYGTNADASMTAFCLIAMQKSRSMCAATINSLPGSIDKAVAYLERRLPHLTNPYAVAMTSYALANEDKLNRQILHNFASPDRSHWPVPKGHTYTLEATAYALLALVKFQAFEEARPVVRWLIQQQKVGGGYGSTQATMMVYQAVAEYWTWAKEPEYDLYVDIILPGRSRPYKLNFNNKNYYMMRKAKIPQIGGVNQDVRVVARGTGEATVTMVSLYYALPKEKESGCQKFAMSVHLIPVNVDQEEAVYKLKTEVLFKDKGHNAAMTILKIGLLNGFTVNTDDLNLLSSGATITKYEMNTVLSERGSLIIYLDQVSHTQPTEITFRIHQTLKLGVLQPAAVSVYENNDEQTQCMKYYHLEGTAGQLLQHKCTCPEERKGQIDSQRLAKLCENTDFVYKIRVEEITAASSTDSSTMLVQYVVRKGSYDVDPQGKLRTLLSYPQCRESLNLQKGKTYLIMGASEDIQRDDLNQGYQYVLGPRTWIEYWPTIEECETDTFRHTCIGMEEMELQARVFRCPA